jgi:parallel beta-helix repeat protein
MGVVAMSSAGTHSVHAQDISLFATAKPKLPPGAKIIKVDDDRRQYKDADFSFINNAIYAANPGDWIRVAPGTYREAIVINKPLRIEGAMFNRPATQRNRLSNFSPAQESILVLGPNLLELSPLYNTIVTVKSANVVLDGFTIQGVGSSDYRVGVGATSASEFSLLNTRIENTTVGVSIGAMSNVTIQGNAFLNNQTYTSLDPNVPSKAGQGISGDTATAVSILSNVFAGNQAQGISLGKPNQVQQQVDEPDQTAYVTNVNISSNSFNASLSNQPSGGGILLQNATTLTLNKNTIAGGSQFGIALDAQDGIQSGFPTSISQNSISGVAGDGLFISNSLLRAVVENNTIANNTGNGVVLSEIGNFINAFNVFRKNRVSNNALSGFLLYFAIGNSLESNTLSANRYGIVVSDSQDNQIKHNSIQSSNIDGIYVNESASGNVFTGNKVQSSIGFDIQDVSVGNGTSGTSNVYRSNKALKTNPVGLGS